MLFLIQESWMNILDDGFYDFQNPKWAFTYIILLWESHFSIHTFPEEKKIICDIYSCNISQDFSLKMRDLIDNVRVIFYILEPKFTTLYR